MARRGMPVYAAPEALPVGPEIVPVAAPQPLGALDLPADPPRRPSILDGLDPEIRAYVERRAAAPDLSGLVEAQAADRATERASVLGANLSRAAALYRGENAGAPVSAVPSAVKDWMMRQKAGAQSDDPLERLKTGAYIHEVLGRKPKAEKPPPEPPPLPTEEQVTLGRGLNGVGAPLPGETAEGYQKRIDRARDRADAKAERGQARADARADRDASRRATGGEFKDLDDLRNEVNDLAETKAVKTLKRAYQNIQQTSDSGAGDISMLYSYIKMLDEGSVVREAEIALAADAGSLLQKAEGWLAKRKSGERMPPEVRAAFRHEADTIMRTAARLYESAVDPIRRIAIKRGYDPADVVTVDHGFKEPAATTQAPAKPAPFKSGASAPAPAASGVVEVKSKEERDALPAGARYTRPGDPTVYVKR